jgi:hypothetical protein
MRTDATYPPRVEVDCRYLTNKEKKVAAFTKCARPVLSRMNPNSIFLTPCEGGEGIRFDWGTKLPAGRSRIRNRMT